ncbi:hypothetical protein CRE_15266 [Caenorhabditis remanei]|uniref:JmjC domain-containing protein n=1 Tax=Caenorhabditis remanei TaxID=31234 RepID=E3MBY4_CAERE|nr:hypothetical protein CRE_15266 [Caenorhabditis remanei]
MFNDSTDIPPIPIEPDLDASQQDDDSVNGEENENLEALEETSSTSAEPTKRPRKRKADGYKKRRQNKKPKASNDPNAPIDQKEVHKRSTRWYAIGCLGSAYVDMQTKGTLPDGPGMDALTSLIAENKEKDCHAFEIPPNFEFADEGNYRGILNTLIHDAVMTRVNEPPQKAKIEKPSEMTPPELCFASKFYMSHEATAKEVIERVKQFEGCEENGVYEEAKEHALFDESDALAKREKELIAKLENREEIESMHENRAVVIEIDARSCSVKELEEQARKTGICNITGFQEKYQIDGKIFDAEELAKCDPDQNLKVRRQLPQSTATNYYMWNHNGIKDHADQLKVYDYEQFVTLKKFADNLEKIKEASEKACQKIIENPDNVEDILEELKAGLRTLMMPLDASKNEHANAKATILMFGTNIDLMDGTKFSNQNEEIKKFPTFLRPNGDGTLLNYSREVIGGLNKPQCYAKPPGARTSPHTENNSLSSVNLNLGPGNCEWLAVPPEQSGKFQNEVAKELKNKTRKPKKRISSEPNEEKITNLEIKEMYNAGYWPNEQKLLAAGIQLQKFIQKPGDLAYVGPLTYHWVQSNGYCTNVSWNIGQPDFCQLAMSGITHDHNIGVEYASVMPIEPIIWRMAEQKAQVDQKLFALIKVFLLRSVAHAQRELEYIEAKGYKFTNNAELGAVMRCTTPRCEKVLFNHVAFNKNLKPLCFKCCNKLTQTEKKEISVVQYKEMDELADICDGYVLTGTN